MPMQVLGTAIGQHGVGGPARRRLNSQRGASAPYHEAVKAANRAAKARAQDVSDAEPMAAKAQHLAVGDASAQPFQADASTTVVSHSFPRVGSLKRSLQSSIVRTVGQRP